MAHSSSTEPLRSAHTSSTGRLRLRADGNAPSGGGSSHHRSSQRSSHPSARRPSPPVSPPGGQSPSGLRRKLTPQSARRKMMYEHLALFAEARTVREARADTERAAAQTADAQAIWGGRSRPASPLAAPPISARHRSAENEMVWKATQLLAAARPDTEDLIVDLSAYEHEERPMYYSKIKARAVKDAEDVATAAAHTATTVSGPSGMVFQHRARLAGRPLETVGEGGESMNREQKRMVMQALTAAKEAANGIRAVADEFSLRPPNIMDRLSTLDEEEAADAERVAEHEELLAKVAANRVVYDAAKHKRDEAVKFVAEMKKKDLDELKTYRTPPETVRQTMMAVVTMLAGDAAFADVTYTKLLQAFIQFGLGGVRLLTAARLSKTLTQYDATKAEESVVLGVKRTFCDDPRWSHENVRKSAAGVAPLCLWVHAQVSVFTANKRMAEIDLEAGSGEIDSTAAVNTEIERTRIIKKMSSVEDAVAMLSAALSAIAGLGEEAKATRKKMLLWRSQLLGMVGKAQYASVDNELLTQVGPSVGHNTTADKRVTERRLATSARLAQTSQGQTAISHAHTVASAILVAMLQKKVTPIEEDDTEKMFSIVMRAYTREREFRDAFAEILPKKVLPQYPVRSNREDTEQDAAIRGARRKRRLAKKRKRDAFKRATRRMAGDLGGILAMKDAAEIARQDEAVLALNQVKSLLEVEWTSTAWGPSDFLELQMPFDRVRTTLFKAVNYFEEKQKMIAEELMSVQVALRFVGVAPVIVGRCLTGLGRGDLPMQLLPTIKGATPPSSYQDLSDLLQVISEGKAILIDTFRRISVADPEALLKKAKSQNRKLDGEDLLLQLHDFCQCIDAAGALDQQTDASFLEKAFALALGLQGSKENAVMNADGVMENLMKLSRAEDHTAASRRKMSTDKGEMSMIGFIAGVVRVAAARNLEICSLHKRVERFINTNLVKVLANEMEADDEITVATRQPVVTTVLEKWTECVRACYIHFAPEEDVEDLTADDGTVDVEALVFGLKDFLKCSYGLGWNDHAFTEIKATILYLEATQPEDGPNKNTDWHALSAVECQILADEMELGLDFEQFQKLIVRIGCMKHRQEAATAEEAVEKRFEVRVAEYADNLIQATILNLHIQGMFETDGDADDEPEEESEYETDTDDEDSNRTEKKKGKKTLSASDRDKMKKGMTGITNAQAGGANAKARDARANLREEAEALAKEAESKSLLDDREVKMLFRAADTDDGGGTLNVTEVKQLLIKLGMDVTDETVTAVLEEMDPDGDGEVTLGEFLIWWKAAGSDVKARMTKVADAVAACKLRDKREKAREKASNPGNLSKEEVLQLFKDIDADGGGYLDRQEVSVLLKHIGLNVDAQGLSKVIEQMAPNGDGEVDVHEFTAWFTRSGKRLQEQLTAFADAEAERKEMVRLAKLRADAGKAAWVQAQRKMRKFELDLQRAALRAWRAIVKDFQQDRGGLALRVWEGMTAQQCALHIAGGVVAQQGAKLTTAAGRLTPRNPQPPRNRFCVECGEKFVMLRPTTVSGLGRAQTHANVVEEDKERTKVLFAAQTQMTEIMQVRDAIVKSKDTGGKERELMLGTAEADIVDVHSVIMHEEAKLLDEMEARKRDVEEHGERRAIPNRELCEKHRPRLCKYTEANGFGALECGRIFSWADPHCRAGGMCCESERA